jgi:ADP-ribose pyrophosphatase YjhB (NUDIX family)
MSSHDSHDPMSETDPAEPRPWQTLNSQYLFDRPWLKVRQDHVRLPRGHELPDYYVVEHPPWVNVIAETVDDCLVLIRQYRHGLGEIHYELPGGVCDAEESLLKAAQRELLEETGFGGGNWREWMVLSANPARQNNRNYTFLARAVQLLERPRPDAGEDIAVQLVTKRTAREIVLGGEMIHALHAGPLLKYFLEGR